jgi:intein/homing endonuclease
MKRSEMLKKLENFLVKQELEGIQIGSREDELANEILWILEEWGMKPPVKKRCSILLTDKYVWESEND